MLPINSGASLETEGENTCLEMVKRALFGDQITYARLPELGRREESHEQAIRPFVPNTTAPIMRGRDGRGRHFINFQYRDIQSGYRHCQTIYEVDRGFWDVICESIPFVQGYEPLVKNGVLNEALAGEFKQAIVRGSNTCKNVVDGQVTRLVLEGFDIFNLADAE